MNQILGNAFTGPGALGYQDPRDLANVAAYITKQIVTITEYERNSMKRPLPIFFPPVHHDRSGMTSEVIGAIFAHIGPFDWETNVNRFDGLIYKRSRPYAYVEVGWVLVRKVLELIEDPEVRYLWLFPSDTTTGILTSSYFITKRASKTRCRKEISREFDMVAKEYNSVFPQ